MKKLAMILAVAGLILAVSATAGATITYKTHLASGDTSAVSYGAGDPDWPTPHMAATYSPPSVKTTFFPTDDIWVAVQLDLTVLEDATDDADGDGLFDVTVEFYDPSNTLRFTYDETTVWGTTWVTIEGWRDTEDPPGTPKWTSLDIWTSGASDESLKDQVTGALDLGTWTADCYIEGGHLNSTNFDVVPEPATLCLLALGGIGVLIRRRRRSA